METCECEIVLDGVTYQYVVRYCPMHAKAPDMLEVLKEIYAWLQRDHGRRNLTYRPAWVEALCAVIESAKE